jgi:tetrahydromethanopterin S-methyltransferase subunit B
MVQDSGRRQRLMAKMATLTSEQIAELETVIDDLLNISIPQKFSICDNSGLDTAGKLSQKEKYEERD